MAINNKKAKKKAKMKRKNFKDRMKSEKEAAMYNKEQKAERNRRFSGQEPKLTLPEDEMFYFDTFWLIQQSMENSEAARTLEVLYARQFFYRLNDTLREQACDNEFTISNKLLSQMGFKKARIEEIIQVFTSNGAFCDCEVSHNILQKCLKDRISYDIF